MQRLDCAVIGAGVIGLAIARKLALGGRHVVVLEAEPRVGMHTSSRNSEVIHAGLYYPPGSLKARLCVEGRRALYEYCARRGVAHKRLGKLLVAVREEERPQLELYARRALANGVEDLRWLDARDVAKREPAVRAVAALHSPSTGILDSDALLRALKADAEAGGADIVLRCRVVRGTIGAQGIVLELADPDHEAADPALFEFRSVVNAAGFRAQSVARSLDGLEPSTIPEAYFAKGHYFVLKGRSPFQQLVYPMPARGGLGVHVTLDLEGNARFGPDTEWVEEPDYQFDESRVSAFCRAIQAYYPAMTEEALHPGFTGIRPKLGPAGHEAQDFVLQGPSAHGSPGLVNCFGIESPGLTSCLAIADEVERLL